MASRLVTFPRRTLTPADVGTAAYLVATGLLIVVFRRNAPTWGEHLALRGVLLAGIAALVWLGRGRWPAFTLLREWYPLPLFLVLYHETGLLMHLVMPGYVDDSLIAFEQRLFHSQPSIWLAAHGPGWLGELMLLVYASYWWLPPIVAAYIWLKASRPAFREFVFAVSTTLYVCYFLFLLLPAAGPRFMLQDAGATLLDGSIVADTINRIVTTEGLRGGAFPSSHVAVMVVVAWYAWRLARPFAPLFTALTILLHVAVVYGRFHYAVDALAGLAVGLLIVAAVSLARAGLKRRAAPLPALGVESPALAAASSVRRRAGLSR